MGLKADRKRSFRPVTTDPKHKFPVAPNLLGQNFQSSNLNKIWLSDITYIPRRWKVDLSICDQRSFQSRDHRLGVRFDVGDGASLESF